MSTKVSRFTKLQVEVEKLEESLGVARSRRDAFLKCLQYRNDSRFSADLEEVILSAIRRKEHLTDVMFMYVSNPKFESDSFFCNCPFCEGDTRRSLEIHVGPDTYECSSCGKKGDAIDFIALLHDCSELEAALFIGMQYNISLDVKLHPVEE